MFVAIYGSMIGTEIANEKGTRIMEVILSSVKAETHFYAKLTGILMVVLTNMVAYALMALAGWNSFSGLAQFKELLSQVKLSDLFSEQFVLVVPFVVLSIVLYTFLAAFSGSLITNVQDVPKAQQPLMMVGLVGYILTLALQSDPTNILLKIASFVPFIQSFVLPSQLAFNAASTVQIVVAFLVLIASMIFTLVFSAKLYKSNVLIYSDGGLFKTLKQSLQNVREEKPYEETNKRGGKISPRLFVFVKFVCNHPA
jgi:ABC-2 type transport system permease protein